MDKLLLVVLRVGVAVFRVLVIGIVFFPFVAEAAGHGIGIGVGSYLLGVQAEAQAFKNEQVVAVAAVLNHSFSSF